MFSDLSKKGRKALVGYLTTGYPDMVRSESDIRTAFDNGVDILEAGVPFSDPTADGAIIQAAGKVALDAGATFSEIIKMLARVRVDYPDKPMILFTYANPLFAYGIEACCDDAVKAGIDGFVVVDVPYEESGDLRKILRSRGLSLISLVAPTTSESRMKQILRDADGFVYYIMVKGVTGERTGLANDVAEHIQKIYEAVDLPVVAGFGISTGDQARKIAHLTDGIVVGSVFVKAAGENRLAGKVKEIAAALC